MKLTRGRGVNRREKKEKSRDQSEIIKDRFLKKELDYGYIQTIVKTE